MSSNTEDLFPALRSRLMARLEECRETREEEILRMIDDLLLQAREEMYIPLSARGELRHMLFNSVRRLDILQELIDTPGITEVMVIGHRKLFIEKEGRLYQWDKQFASREKLEDIAQQIVAGCNRIVNESVPIVDARLADGSRVNIVMPPVALEGPVITIRRFPEHPITMDQLIRLGSVTEEAAEELHRLVAAGYNIFISGGTGSGKTTFLNALSAFIPEEERIITIEDNAELQILGKENLVRLEARGANAEGEMAVTIRDLIRTSLRMRPDRVIIGEVRGGEVVDLLPAMNTGHDGSLSTGHGNSPRDMLSRLEMMFLMGMSDVPLAAIRRQIASAIDILIHLQRFRDRSRRVAQIVEVTGFDTQTGEITTRVLYEFEEEMTVEQEEKNACQKEDGLRRKTGTVIGRLRKRNSLSQTEKLVRAGFSLCGTVPGAGCGDQPAVL